MTDESKLTPQDRVSMKLGELFILVVDLRSALKLERSGTPLSAEQYARLDSQAEEATFGLKEMFGINVR